MNVQSTSQRVQKSLLSMVLVRPISAIGGILILVLLSRLMSQEDYGTYFACWALIEISILASNFGLIHAVFRFVNASVTATHQVIPHGPVAALTIWRLISLAIAASIIAFLPQTLTQHLQLGQAQVLLPMVAVILMAEGFARFMENIFDTMLLQGRSQITTVMRTLMRLAGILFCLISTDSLSLIVVLKIEVVSTLVGTALGLVFLLRLYCNRQRTEQPQTHGFWRMTKFAFPAFIAQVGTTLYGPDAIKLIINANIGPQEVALFGFAYALAAVVQRYIPANLLGGIFRPVFVSASQRPDAKIVLGEMFMLSLKLNWLVITPLIVFVVLFGELVAGTISGGRYDVAADVLTFMLVALLPVAFHLTLSNLCLAMEDSWPLLLGTFSAVLVLVPGVLLIHYWGALGGVFSYLCSEIAWSIMCIYLILKKYQINFTGGHGKLAFQVVSPVMLAFLCSHLLQLNSLWGMETRIILLLVMAGILYFWGYFSHAELKLLERVSMPIAQYSRRFLGGRLSA